MTVVGRDGPQAMPEERERCAGQCQRGKRGSENEAVRKRDGMYVNVIVRETSH